MAGSSVKEGKAREAGPTEGRGGVSVVSPAVALDPRGKIILGAPDFLT
jgi:hypothetical protein